MSCHKLTKGHCKGFFRIPQVSDFVRYAFRNLSDRQITEIPALFTDSKNSAKLIKGLIPQYKLMGEKLIAMYRAKGDSFGRLKGIVGLDQFEPTSKRELERKNTSSAQKSKRYVVKFAFYRPQYSE